MTPPVTAKIPRPAVSEIEDVQGRADTRRLPINRVGIKDISHPVRVRDRSAGEQIQQHQYDENHSFTASAHHSISFIARSRDLDTV